jgi:hypothetical protein
LNSPGAPMTNGRAQPLDPTSGLDRGSSRRCR